MNEPKKYTLQQLDLVNELVAAHGLDASQISFDGEDLTPIFDYEAVCLLSLRLTDIQSLECEISKRHEPWISAKCNVTLPDGRSRTVEASAMIGELMGDGSFVDSFPKAEALARSRASRLGIRAVGINLFRAHKKFLEDGEIASANTNHHPRKPVYNEIHMLAENLDFIVDGDKTEYRQFLAETFNGRKSATDLDDIEIQRLLTMLRSLNRIRIARLNAQKAAA